MSEPRNHLQPAYLRRLCWRLTGPVAFLVSCLKCGAVVAETAPSEASLNANPRAPELTSFEPAVATDVSMVSYAWSGGSSSATALGASFRLSRDQLETAVGARGLLSAALVGASLEVFLSGALTPALGLWHPSLGVELGYSSLTQGKRQAEPKAPAGSDEDSRPRPGRAYVSLAAAPLRVRLGPLKVSALGLDVGSTLPDLGRGFRVAIVLARLEWRLP